MKKICIVYDSVSGSTAEIAKILGNGLSVKSYSVKIIQISGNCDISDFDIVIIGSPLRFGGFTSKIKKFIRKYKDQLKDKQVFSYLTILYITRINDKSAFEIPYFIDPSLGIRTIQKHDASPIDLNHSLDYYHKKLDNHLRGIRLQGVAFFNGRLIIKKLPILYRIFMKLVISLTTKEREGDFLNPDAVREWAANILWLIQ